MRSLTSILSIVALTFALGCGDDGGGDGSTTVDAGPTFDAAPTADAMPASGSSLAGLCQAPDTLCQADFPACLSAAQNGPGYCSTQCGTDVDITTTAEGGIPLPTDPALHAICTAGYTGVGTPVCGIIIGGTLPAPPTPPEPNTAYKINIACGVQCEATTMACPTGLTCTQGYCGR
jgi:hypothetical protein